MNITSIVNKDAFNISNCHEEPIRIPGSIQPHGMLLIADRPTGIITHCSANTAAFLDKEPALLLGQPLANIDDILNNSVQDAIDSCKDTVIKPVFYTASQQQYKITIHHTKDSLLLEFEPYVPEEEKQSELLNHTRQFISHIERSSNLKELCQSIANETRRITAYDRVMIYKFDREYNGEVYAESKAEDIEPFLDLHYPHTDIPPQARELYLQNLIRTIPDVNYTPVALLTASDSPAQQPDLSDVSLRSVSPIHIQYLKNMNVGATLTVSLLQDGRLWGLIACHHRQPKLLSYSQQQFALLQGHFLTSQIKVRQVAEEYEVNVVVEAHLQQLLNKIDADEDFSQKFEQFTSLLAIANATGAVVLHNGILYERGLVPAREKTLQLIRWIDQNIKSVMFSTSCLSKRYPAGNTISKYASGIIYHALGKPTENCIIWFREEVIQTVKWAGNPGTAIQQDPVTKSLTPRKSFEIWQEQLRHQATDWRVSEINATIRFATSLQNHFHLVYLQNEENNLRVLNEKLQKANQELSNINWITSHDLKEPLRKIQIFASRIVDKEGQNLSEQIRDHTLRIQKSANRMQHLVDDILSYSVTGNTNVMYSIADLNTIAHEVKDILKEELEEKNGKLHIGTLPGQVRVVPSQITQLFTNLISNSIKFSGKDVAPDIVIECNNVNGKDVMDAGLPHENDYYHITLTDNGIGFDETHSKRIFDIFYKLHNNDSYKGTGIGLAICKKIVENHHGSITAKSKEGSGATFNIYLLV